jgi:hypothetical protein
LKFLDFVKNRCSWQGSNNVGRWPLAKLKVEETVPIGTKAIARSGQ